MNWQRAKRFPWTGALLIMWMLLNAVLMVTGKVHTPNEAYEQDYDLSDPGEIDLID
jgi:hypothetical protein